MVVPVVFSCCKKLCILEVSEQIETIFCVPLSQPNTWASRAVACLHCTIYIYWHFKKEISDLCLNAKRHNLSYRTQAVEFISLLVFETVLDVPQVFLVDGTVGKAQTFSFYSSF